MRIMNTGLKENLSESVIISQSVSTPTETCSELLKINCFASRQRTTDVIVMAIRSENLCLEISLAIDMASV